MQRLRNLFEHGHNEFTDGVHLTRPIAEYCDDMIALVSEELVPEVRLPLEVIVFVEIGVKLLRRTLQEALERPRDPRLAGTVGTLYPDALLVSIGLPGKHALGCTQQVNEGLVRKGPVPPAVRIADGVRIDLRIIVLVDIKIVAVGIHCYCSCPTNSPRTSCEVLFSLSCIFSESWVNVA